MKRLAVFVEGQTEMIFMRRLIEEIAGRHKVAFQFQTVGGATPSPFVKLMGSATTQVTATTSYVVLIFDCQQDSKVKSAILDRRKSLEAAGYAKVIGLRDLYPMPLAQLNIVKLHLKTGVPTKGLPIHILLAVAEIEAWFVKEHTHFQKIDPRLDPSTFAASVGFDPRTGDVENIPHPSELLHQIYQLAGKGYRKTRAHVERTVDSLDYAALYVQATQDVPHLKALVECLDDFLA